MSLLRTAFAVRRGSGSFIADSMAMDDSSPAARLDARYPEQPRPLHTPAPPAAEAQRSGSGEAAHGPDSSSSSLSGAATSRAPLAAGLAGDPWGGGDMSPALLRRPEPERRVPSCPHKQGSNPAKRHTAVASPPADVTEEIRPRTLDMTRSPNDPNDMSLSPMNLASAGGISPSPGPPAAGAGRRHGVRPPERPEREGRLQAARRRHRGWGRVGGRRRHEALEGDGRHERCGGAEWHRVERTAGGRWKPLSRRTAVGAIRDRGRRRHPARRTCPRVSVDAARAWRERPGASSGGRR